MVILERVGVKFPKGFDVDVRRLDRSYIDNRYPNGVGGAPEDFYDRQTLEELMQCCTRVMGFVKSKLS